MRIRTIKPEFWSHPVLARQPDAVRLMAIGLLTYADDEGYFSSDETLVRNSLRPFDKDSGNSLESLRRLSEVGFIELCEHPSRGPIGRVVNFAKHQKISHPTRSRLAAYWYQENIQKHSGAIPEPLRPDLGIKVSRDQGIKGAREADSGESSAPAVLRSKKFTPPTITQVIAYCLEKDLNVEADAFFDHFTSNGWRVSGKAPMVDWKSSVRNWERRNASFGPAPTKHGGTQAERDEQMEAAARSMCQS